MIKKAAIKGDAEKSPIGLIPREALEEEARALQFGAKKYGENNWRRGRGLEWSRLYDAALRHVLAFVSGEDIDPESGASHLACARASLGFLETYRQTNTGIDNRYNNDTLTKKEEEGDAELSAEDRPANVSTNEIKNGTDYEQGPF